MAKSRSIQHPTATPSKLTNHLHRSSGFSTRHGDVTGAPIWRDLASPLRVASIRPKCSICMESAPCHDHLPQRERLFAFYWEIETRFLYSPRPVECHEHGVVVEHIPWSDGKRPITKTMMSFLDRWAHRLSWKRTSEAFGTSWECVYPSVVWVVCSGGCTPEFLKESSSLALTEWISRLANLGQLAGNS